MLFRTSSFHVHYKSLKNWSEWHGVVFWVFSLNSWAGFPKTNLSAKLEFLYLLPVELSSSAEHRWQGRSHSYSKAIIISSMVTACELLMTTCSNPCCHIEEMQLLLGQSVLIMFHWQTELGFSFQHLQHATWLQSRWNDICKRFASVTWHFWVKLDIQRETECNTRASAEKESHLRSKVKHCILVKDCKNTEIISEITVLINCTQ